MIIIEGSTLARASILIAFLGFFAEFLLRSNKRLFDRGFFYAILVLIKPGIIGICLFILVAGLRVYSSNNIHIIIYEKFQSYVFASYDLFFVWFEHFERDQFGFGSNTFAFIVKLMGFEI